MLERLPGEFLTAWWPLLAILVALLALGLLVAWLRRGGHRRFPYATQPVMTDAERAFHRVLQQATPRGTFLLAKVRMADYLKVDGENRMERGTFIGHFNAIARKHTDFLIVDAQTSEPLLAIELDDATHRHNRRTMESDAFKNAACRAAGLALLRVPVARAYDRRELAEAIEAEIRAAR